MTPLERAVEICTSQAELARRIGGNVKQAHVWNWLNSDSGLAPAEHCRAIETATDGEVTRYELRPDVFGPAPYADPGAGASTQAVN